MSRPAPLPTTVPALRPSVPARLWRHFWALSGWTKLILVIALTMGVVGVAGVVVGATQPTPPAKVEAQTKVDTLRAQGFAGNSLTTDQQQTLDTAKQQVSQAGHWFYDKTAPTLWRVGIGFVVFFVVGFMARSFLKSVAFFAAGILFIATAAAYFGFIDLGHFRDNLTSSTGWAMDQLNGFKDLLVKSVGISLSGVVGFVVGFLRK